MEPSSKTETEDETVAQAKRTARRVSFADNEITSVHLFPTDDAEQTPPLNSASDSVVVNDQNDDVVSSPFLRPTASPPSSTDDGDEGFRAPVSASFIAPVRLSGSDSGFSDDLTMDSTAFSLHFRSLARSDSADLRTPSQTLVPTATTRSFMMTLSKAKSHFSGSSFRIDDSASGARDSNDMSVVEGDGNPFRYDHHRISPSLDAILAEGTKVGSSVSGSSNRSGYFSAKGNEASIIRSPGSLINSVSERKHDESPAKGVIVVSNCIQEAPTPSMTFLQARLSELRCRNMQDLSHKANSDGNGFGAEISSGKKRKGCEILRYGDRVDEMGRIDTSPQLHKERKSDQRLALEGTGDMRSEKEKLGDQTRKTWTDIVKDFLWGTKQWLSPSVDKLNLRAIGALEDILVHLQKVNIWEAFCSEIHDQRKIADPLNILRLKRFGEARSLLFNLAYGRAKLQLMHIKREKLLKKIQLSSGLQEFHMMKLNGILSKHEAVDSQANASHLHSISLSSEGEFQVSCEKIITMRQELETLAWKGKSLNKSFHTYCKMENHQSLADTIVSVSDYLKKRIFCKCLFQNLQLWDITDFEHVDGCYRVVLNYYGYVIQGFTVNACPSPSIIISNKLNDVKIVKTFPGINAFFAFMIIFNPHTTKKYTDTKGLAQETQVTSSLLSNLLDVIDEVQLAQIEVRNMIQAKFCSESVGQLDLLLSFIDFCSGRMVKVTLDMTCLTCGVYPLDILPYRIYDPASGEQKSSSLVAEIGTALKSVRVGYSRIMRLCRCISQAVQAFTLNR